MKKIILICMSILMMVACSKKSSSPAPASTASVASCKSSTWTYQIEFGTSVSSGQYDILYLDGYNNTIEDTAATGTIWTKSIVPNADAPVFSLNIVPGPNFINHVSANCNLTNTIRLSILRDGVITKTTGVFLNFCQSNGSSCAAGTVNTITLNDYCN